MDIKSSLIYCAIAILSFPGYSEQNYLHTCDRLKCDGQFQIVDAPPVTNIVSESRVNVTVEHHSENVHIIVYKRNKLSVYCYDGTSIDPNTGCTQSVKKVTHTPEEARKWIKNGRCETGRECIPGGNCWGNDANACFDDTIFETKGPTSLKWQNMRDMRFPFHTCIQSWECSNTMVELPLQLKMENGTLVSYVTMWNQQEVIIDSDLYYKGKGLETGETITTLNDNPVTHRTQEETVCMSSNLDNIICQYTKGKSSGLTFDLKRNLMNIVGNTLIKAMSSITTIGKDGNETKIYPGNPLENDQSLNTLSGASIQSLTDAVNQIRVTQLQSIYNSINLASSHNKMLNVVNKIVRSLGKIDHMLISQMTDSKFSTKWITNETFTACPCYTADMSVTSNCDKGFIYKNGELKNISKDDICVNIDEKKITKIKLTESPKISIRVSNSMPMQVSTRDSNVWTELNNILNAKLHNSDYSKDASSAKTIYMHDTLNNMIEVFSISKWLYGASSVVAWISLLLHFLRRNQR